MRDWVSILRIDSDAKLPLYYQVLQNLHDLIESGELPPGEALPSEWDLSKLYGVSRLTVRKALDELARDGWITRRHGVGSFVANPKAAQIMANRMSFTQKMQEIGRKASSRVISCQVVPATQEVASHLGLEPRAPAIELVRLRLADGEAISLETAYLSQERFPELTEESLGDGSLYQFLSDHYGVSIAAVDQTLEPMLLSRMEAQFLGAEQGSPAMLSDVVARDEQGVAVEYAWSVTRGDKCKFYFRFREGVLQEQQYP